MAKTIDINVDLGEGFGFDDELLQIASSANVGCGVHAGSEVITFETVEKCLAKGVRVGLHPGYPDRESMGRKSLQPGQERVYLDSIADQITRFCRKYQADYLKPHGGFYNDLGIVMEAGWDSMVRHPGSKSPYEAGGQEMSKTAGTGMLIVQLRIFKLKLMGLAGTYHEEIARRAGYGFIREGFADRRYLPDGRLVRRSQPGAVLETQSEIEAQVLNLAETCDSICIHGDTAGAVRIAEWVRVTLESRGYQVQA